ncbi:MAG: Holliday junction branch migration DNA helicase RuvB, partial [Planctomycetota bacterium]
QLQEGDVLFIDEIHRLPQVVEEHLFSAMEDFVLDIVLDSGPAARNVRIPLNRFTLVGATTQEGRLSRPFRDRFQIHEKLELYPPSDLEKMIDRSARILRLVIDPRARAEVSRRSRGTPRIVNRLLRRLRDFAQVDSKAGLTLEICRMGLEKLGIDERGLDATDRRILKVIALSGGQPVGLKTIAASVGEDEETLQEVYEPYLLQEQFIMKTPRGRVLGRASSEVAGLPISQHPLPFPEP